ncbi:MAG: NnrU family protein [Allosphingosinicella sp.]
MIATVSLALATLAFVGSHLALSHPYRLALVGRMGEQLFLAFYSLVAIATLAWMVFAWRSIDNSVAWWVAPDWAWWVASGVMLVASVLLAGSLVRNPALPHPGARPRIPAAPKGVYAITRHPMNWSFILWALAHLAVWGSPRNVIVAVGILVLAVAGSIGQDRKKADMLGPPWLQWMERTSFVPFGAVLARKVKARAAVPGAVALGGGFVFWLAVTWFHAPDAQPLRLLIP